MFNPSGNILCPVCENFVDGDDCSKCGWEQDSLTPKDEYEVWYNESIEASNEYGYACMSAADVIRTQEAEIQRLREYELMYKELCK